MNNQNGVKDFVEQTLEHKYKPPKSEIVSDINKLGKSASSELSNQRIKALFKKELKSYADEAMRILRSLPSSAGLVKQQLALFSDAVTDGDVDRAKTAANNIAAVSATYPEAKNFAQRAISAVDTFKYADHRSIIEKPISEWFGHEDEIREALEHHQIKGARWGVHHGPPYPLRGEDRKRSREFAKKNREQKKREKEKKKIKKRIAKVQKKQAKQEQKDAKEQQRKEEKDRKAAEDLAKEKKKYARDPAQLYRHREMYNAEEIAECLKTFEMEAKVKSFIAQNTEHKKSQIARWTDTTASLVKFGASAADLYNLYASVNRYLGGTAVPFTLYSKGDNNPVLKATQNSQAKQQKKK